MTQETKIEWTERTWNPIVGCSLASPGCTNCYAMRMAYRLSKNPKTPQYHGTAKMENGNPVFTGKLELVEKALLEPLKRKAPTTYFVNSMGDLFHEDMPDEWIDRVFAVMALCPQHTFQVLTKRADRMRDYMMRCYGRVLDLVSDRFERGWPFEFWQAVGIERFADAEFTIRTSWPLPNVWLGVSVEDDKRAVARIPDLLATRAAIRFISVEPLLGPIDWKRWLPTGRKVKRPDGRIETEAHYYMTLCTSCGWIGSSELCGSDYWGDDSDVYCPDCNNGGADHEVPSVDWVICGGESGPGARPMHPDWARSLRDQCGASGAAFFFKQWGEWLPIPAERHPIEYTDHRGHAESVTFKADGQQCVKVGKKAAGRLLDGREHNGFPPALTGGEG